MQTPGFCAIAMLPVIVALGAANTAAVDRAARVAAPPTACSAAAYGEFDFFVGDWDTYDATDSTKIVARNHVTHMLGRCAIREVYEQTDGLKGESFSTWNVARGQWHQSWVTNRGDLLLLDGGLRDGRMVLTGTERRESGSPSLLRGTWIPDGRDVREIAERSTDGGKSWAPVFDIVFRPHR